jgi:hypothetical protein
VHTYICVYIYDAFSPFERGTIQRGKSESRGTGKTKVGKDLFILAHRLHPV